MSIINKGRNLINTTYGYKNPIKEQKQNRGKWYYEVTYLSGDFCFIAGFEAANSFYTFFGQAKTPKFYIGNSSLSTNLYIPIEINDITANSVYGIMIDLDEGKFGVLYKNEEFWQFFDDKSNKWGMRILGGCSNNAHDLIWVNPGESAFTYQIPSGYKAWIKTINTRISCHNKKSHSFSIFLVIFYLIS